MNKMIVLFFSILLISCNRNGSSRGTFELEVAPEMEVSINNSVGVQTNETIQNMQEEVPLTIDISDFFHKWESAFTMVSDVTESKDGLGTFTHMYCYIITEQSLKYFFEEEIVFTNIEEELIRRSEFVEFIIEDIVWGREIVTLNDILVRYRANLNSDTIETFPIGYSIIGIARHIEGTWDFRPDAEVRGYLFLNRYDPSQMIATFVNDNQLWFHWFSKANDAIIY